MASDDSEWDAEEEEEEEHEEAEDEESFHDDDDSSANSSENKKPAARKKKPKTNKEGCAESNPAEAGGGAAAAIVEGTSTGNSKNSREARRRKRLRRVDFDAEESDEIDHMPSHQRLTAQGGYMHTKDSRLKISQANRGKAPWNKGRNRSETAKARISAGVRARNHAVLLVKLGKLGMTQEEWFAKKKQIKLLRERVRKSRVAAKKYEEETRQKELMLKGDALQKQLNELVQEIETDDDESNNNNGEKQGGVTDIMDTSERIEEMGPNPAPAVEIADVGKPVYATLGEVAMNDETTHVAMSAERKQPKVAIFARDFRWTPHIFDSKDISYKMLCPHGGPGGLVCCDSCTASYAKYLTKTFTDMETQKIAKVGDEVKELLDFTRDAKQKLSEAIKVARRKPVPIRRNPVSVNAEPSTTTATRKAPPQVVNVPTTPVGPSMEFPETMITEHV